EFVYDNSLGMDYEAADRVQENTYKLMPGSTYFKDPKVTVLAGSERSYVFVKVTETNNPHEWHNGSAIIEWDVNDSYWLPVKDNEGNLVEGLYYYKDVVDVENYTDVKDFVKDKGSNSVVSDPYLNNVNGNGDRVLPSVIKDAKIKIRDTYDGVYKDDSDNYYNPEEEGITPELKFDAYAIQADNMEGSIYDIWTRLDKQLNPSAYDDSTSSN
ncbi:MAG: hypothetical protein IKJ05_02045, partial [Oscillospiraceae bacterium]|nr:hypothetical protein [Oscillospiraceae bacterium]